MVRIDDIETTNTAVNILNNEKWFFERYECGYLHHKSFVILVNCACVWAWIEVEEEEESDRTPKNIYVYKWL